MDEEQVMEQVTPEADCAAEFEELIRGRCRQPFQQRVQKILDGRLRTLRQENEALRRQAQERQGFENDCVARLAREAEDIRRVYDGFDWQREMRDPAFGRLIAAGERYLASRRQTFAQCAAALDAMSPLKVLGRGYAVASDAAGTVLRSAGQVQPGDAIRVQLQDGALHCTVNDREEAHGKTETDL